MGSFPAKPRSEEVLRDLLANLFCKIDAILNYDDEGVKNLRSSFVLFKPTELMVTTVSEDYGLSKYTQRPIEVKQVDGNHRSIVGSPVIINYINDAFSSK